VRHFALEYANHTLGGAVGDLTQVLNALGLPGNCSKEFDLSLSRNETIDRSLISRAGKTFYVSLSGSDTSGDGSSTKPFATLVRAQKAARGSSVKPVTVLVHEGTYFLNEPLHLGDADSGAEGKETIYAAYPGEKVVLSGGRKLDGLSWKAWNNTSSASVCAMHIYNHTACTRNPYKQTAKSDLASCCNACQSDPNCGGFTLHGGSECYLSHTKDTNNPNFKSNGITCGVKKAYSPTPSPASPTPPPAPTPPPPTAGKILVTDLPPGLPSGFDSTDAKASFNGLFIGGQMQWRARYPNGSPLVPRDGYSEDGDPFGTTKKGKITPLAHNVHITCSGGVTASVTGSMYPLEKTFNFSVPCDAPPASSSGDGAGLQYGPDVTSETFICTGDCALNRFNPPLSYWASTVPGGLSNVERAAMMNWTNPEEWQVHAYHPQSWGNWGFAVASFEEGVEGESGEGEGAEGEGGEGEGGDREGQPNGQKMTFATRGGHQEARGGGNGMGARFFEGMREELDSAHEFYHDTHSTPQRLFWVQPLDATPTSTARAGAGGVITDVGEVVVPMLETVVRIGGSSSEDSNLDRSLSSGAAMHIAFRGFTIAHTLRTFCCDHDYESVSGGDW
jgi:hypothetical protein